MGHDQSKSKLSLAEKRYKIDKPKPKRRATSVGPGTTPRSACSDDGIRTCPISPENTTYDREELCAPLSARSTISNGSTPAPILVDDPNAKHFLTRRERILLQNSWRKTRKTGSEHVGSKIFFMVLTAQPDIKSIFGLEKIPQGRLKYDPRFRQHAVVFTKTFDFVIKNLDFPDKLENHLENLGRKHVIMQGRGFDPAYWETFAECMTQAAVEWEANRQRPTLQAWRTLVAKIIMAMRRGYDEENAKRRLQISTVGSMVRKTSGQSCPYICDNRFA